MEAPTSGPLGRGWSARWTPVPPAGAVTGSKQLAAWACRLSRHLLATAHPGLWDRAQQVVCRAGRISRAIVSQDEQDVLAAAAWLHNIGHATAVVKSGYHPLDAARYLTERTRFPLRVSALVAHHCPAASGAAVRGLADQLAGYPDEQSLTKDVLWHCVATAGSDDELLAPTGRSNQLTTERRLGSLTTDAPDHGHRQMWAATSRVVAALSAIGPTRHLRDFPEQKRGPDIFTTPTSQSFT